LFSTALEHTNTVSVRVAEQSGAYRERFSIHSSYCRNCSKWHRFFNFGI